MDKTKLDAKEKAKLAKMEERPTEPRTPNQQAPRADNWRPLYMQDLAGIAKKAWTEEQKGKTPLANGAGKTEKKPKPIVSLTVERAEKEGDQVHWKRAMEGQGKQEAASPSDVNSKPDSMCKQ